VRLAVIAIFTGGLDIIPKQIAFHRAPRITVNATDPIIRRFMGLVKEKFLKFR
jgi:hypothetical protein